MTLHRRRFAALIAFIVVTGLAAQPHAANAVEGAGLQRGFQTRAADKSITGVWTLSAEGYTMEMELTQDEREITGTVQSPHGPVAIRGIFDNVWLVFSGASNGKPHAIELTAKGILRADGTLAGVMTSNVGDFTWTAVRHDR